MLRRITRCNGVRLKFHDKNKGKGVGEGVGPLPEA